tara:strand:+ start:9779 stop:11176 length:1398 start_codon:yes stop_codon:yes gene_type:complete
MKSMEEILNGSVDGMAAAIRQGDVSSVELTNAFIARIEAVNPTLNALVMPTFDLARKYAERADQDLAKGEIQGVLHGVPMTMKDSLDTFDAVTTWGTLGRKDFRPGVDATAVARLRAQGAVLMGKTNTPEFTLSFKTDNLVYGSTKNPHDPERTPGGSSGGAAALIAAGASPFDLGTDTGGSIRLPSHYSGIAGIKPTSGRVPCTGNALPISGLTARISQVGPMARRVSDLALLLDIISGPDNQDPYCLPAEQRNYNDVDIEGLRIAWHSDNGICTPESAVVSAVETARDLLTGEGMSLTEARPSGLEMSQLISSRVFNADDGLQVENLLADARTEQPSPLLGSRPKDLPESSARDVATVMNVWDNYRSSMLSFFDDFDVLICPVNATTAIPLEAPIDFSAFSYTMAYNMTGWPGTVIRAGTDANHLPVGIQIIAAPFREDHSLAVAQWLENALGPFAPPAISAW